VARVSPERQLVSDEELARLARAGSLTGFEELVYRYEARIFNFLANCCRNPTDARDLTQETFVAAYRNVERFDPARSFATWLFTIARRKLIDDRRGQRRLPEQSTPEQIDGDDPAVLLARREAQQDLWQVAGDRLSAVQFQALWLKYAEEMSVRDIARVLRRTQTHVKVILFRARVALGDALQAERLREGSQSGAGPQSPRLPDRNERRTARQDRNAPQAMARETLIRTAQTPQVDHL
jgi:RNA polymerase sigma-70 factor, ECF subfamily